MEATALLSADGRIEPPSNELLEAMLTLPRSDRAELAAVLGGMAMEASRRTRRGPRRA